jgi:Retrotransposon gag protein/Zinc knuckle
MSQSSVKGAGNQMPSMTDIIKKIIELEGVIGSMQGKEAHTTIAQGRSLHGYKVQPPEAFDGTRGKLQAFLTQMGLYLLYYSENLQQEKDKVLCAANLLKGSAFEWFEPRLRDYLDNPEPERDPETVRLFSRYSHFTTELRAVFGEVDEQRTAERKLMQLRQTGSASNYTSEFRKITSKLDWNDEAYMAQYYQGLKDALKDELARQESPDDLDELIRIAVRIDNRLYERKLEKTGKTPYRQPVRSSKNRKNWGDPMEIDAVIKRKDYHKKKQGKWQPGKQNEQKSQESQACFNCGKPGHFARNCKNKKVRTARKENPKVQSDVDHATRSWTTCYDDDCSIHLSEKQGRGWSPGRPGAKGQPVTVAYTGRKEAQQLEVPVLIQGNEGTRQTTALIDSGAQGNFINYK